MQLRSAVINLGEGLHPQECARARRTKKKAPEGAFFSYSG